MSDAAYNQVLKAVEKGEEKAKTYLAWYKLSGIGCERNVNEAVLLLEEREKTGDREAKWMLGICKEYGIGTEQDIKRAEKLYAESREAKSETGIFLATQGRCGRGTGKMKTQSS